MGLEPVTSESLVRDLTTTPPSHATNHSIIIVNLCSAELLHTHVHSSQKMSRLKTKLLVCLCVTSVPRSSHQVPGRVGESFEWSAYGNATTHIHSHFTLMSLVEVFDLDLDCSQYLFNYWTSASRSVQLLEIEPSPLLVLGYGTVCQQTLLHVTHALWHFI